MLNSDTMRVVPFSFQFRMAEIFDTYRASFADRAWKVCACLPLIASKRMARIWVHASIASTSARVASWKTRLCSLLRKLSKIASIRIRSRTIHCRHRRSPTLRLRIGRCTRWQQWQRRRRRPSPRVDPSQRTKSTIRRSAAALRVAPARPN